MKRVISFVFLAIAVVYLISCAQGDPHQKYPKSPSEQKEDDMGKIQKSDIVLWSSDGGGLINPRKIIVDDERIKQSTQKVSDDKNPINHTQLNTDQNINAINVNQYLWQSALSNLSSMPILIADKNAGLIVTDWHKITDGMRRKINIIFNGTKLQSSAVEVKVFTEVKDSKTGSWVIDESNNDKSQFAEHIYNKIVNGAKKLQYFSADRQS